MYYNYFIRFKVSLAIINSSSVGTIKTLTLEPSLLMSTFLPLTAFFVLSILMPKKVNPSQTASLVSGEFSPSPAVNTIQSTPLLQQRKNHILSTL